MKVFVTTQIRPPMTFYMHFYTGIFLRVSFWCLLCGKLLRFGFFLFPFNVPGLECDKRGTLRYWPDVEEFESDQDPGQRHR